ncbi:MAG: hypothetical protein ACI8TP_002284 [Acidimicrobiales bacterium]|jgi:hypothetical protein
MLMFHALVRASGDSGQRAGRRWGPPDWADREWGQRGQATAEYALVILGAAALAGLVLAWAASTGKIARLLNAVLDSVIGQVG